MRRIITVSFVLLFISLAFDLKAQVCGNGICEDMELDGCPFCTKQEPRCLMPCDSFKVCPQDCSNIQQITRPVCGNGICEDMELDGCPSCTKQEPRCLVLCDSSKACPQDCPQPSTNFQIDVTLNRETGVICTLELNLTSGPICTKCSQGFCQGNIFGGVVNYAFVNASFSNFVLTRDGKSFPLNVQFDLKQNAYFFFSQNGVIFLELRFDPSLGLYRVIH